MILHVFVGADNACLAYSANVVAPSVYISCRLHKGAAL